MVKVVGDLSANRVECPKRRARDGARVGCCKAVCSDRVYLVSQECVGEKVKIILVDSTLSIVCLGIFAAQSYHCGEVFGIKSAFGIYSEDILVVLVVVTLVFVNVPVLLIGSVLIESIAIKFVKGVLRSGRIVPFAADRLVEVKTDIGNTKVRFLLTAVMLADGFAFLHQVIDRVEAIHRLAIVGDEFECTAEAVKAVNIIESPVYIVVVTQTLVCTFHSALNTRSCCQFGDSLGERRLTPFVVVQFQTERVFRIRVIEYPGIDIAESAVIVYHFGIVDILTAVGIVNDLHSANFFIETLVVRAAGSKSPVARLDVDRRIRTQFGPVL